MALEVDYAGGDFPDDPLLLPAVWSIPLPAAAAAGLAALLHARRAGEAEAGGPRLVALADGDDERRAVAARFEAADGGPGGAGRHRFVVRCQRGGERERGKEEETISF